MREVRFQQYYAGHSSLFQEMVNGAPSGLPFDIRYAEGVIGLSPQDLATVMRAVDTECEKSRTFRVSPRFAFSSNALPARSRAVHPLRPKFMTVRTETTGADFDKKVVLVVGYMVEGVRCDRGPGGWQQGLLYR